MATRKPRKREYLNSDNAVSVSNRGRKAAYTQAYGQPSKDDNGNWRPYGGDMVTRTRSGRMSVDGRKAGGYTHTFTPKNDDGSPVIGKSGAARQSGRSKIASRRQRYYDVVAGLNNVVGEKARAALGLDGAARGMGLSVG